MVTPNLFSPRRYLPMNDPRAVRWHRKMLFVSGTAGHLIVRAGLGGLLATPAARVLLSMMTPRYVVIGTAVEDHSPPGARLQESQASA